MISERDFARFHAKTRPGEGGCLVWTGQPDNGYGRFWLQGRCALAHRVAWQIAGRSIPEGQQLDHLCRNRACVNVDHLEPVTIAENVLRGTGRSAVNARRTHCVNGHQLAGENLYVNRGRRLCNACARRRTKEWRQRQVSA
jgi:hypothetical protein